MRPIDQILELEDVPCLVHVHRIFLTTMKEKLESGQYLDYEDTDLLRELWERYF